MLFTSASVALFSLLPLLSASPLPPQKRFTGATIKSYRTGTCLTLNGASPSDGALLGTGDCSTATKWDINPGSGSVIVSGTNFALDAGIGPKNFVQAKVWTSYPGLEQQTWYLTPDNRIAITGGDQCLDQGDNGPQTYKCTTGNTNQIWYVEGAANPPPSSSVSTSVTSSVSTTLDPSSTASSTSSSPSSTATSGPIGPVTQIKWATDPTACLSITEAPTEGTPVILQKCLPSFDANIFGQLFYTFQNGVIQLARTQYCLDAGSEPSNGTGMKLWLCDSGLPQQRWNFRQDNLLQTANNQCLNVDNSNYQRLQTWECSSSDPNQKFVL